MSPVAEGLEGVLPNSVAGIAATIVIFLATFLVLHLVGRAILLPITRRILHRRKLDEHARKPLMRITRGFILFGSLVVALGVAGLEGFLLALAGVAAAGTLALGIALQNVIQNLVAGIFIYVDEPFRIGDWVEWNEGSGTVIDIRLRTTQVKTFDNELLTVPNSQLTENVVKNYMAYDSIRQRFSVGIGFEDDVNEAIEYILDEADGHPDILEDPEPTVRLTELGDSAVLLEARVWIANPNKADFIRIRGEFGRNVKRRLSAEGINIPFPIRTLDGAVTVQESAPSSE